MVEINSDGVTCYIADQAAVLSLTSLLSNIATFHVLVDDSSQGTLFSLCGHGYKIALWKEGDTVFFQRNGHILSRKMHESKHNVTIAAVWKFDKMQLAVFSPENTDDDSVCASLELDQKIYVPQSLIVWARKYSRLSEEKPQTQQEAISLLMNSIHQIQNKIKNENLYHSFWDYDRFTGEKVSPKPKTEPQSFGLILGLLQDIALTRGFALTSEVKLGIGRADAVCIIPLADGTQIKIAIEAKNAHSPDIFDGLEKQLPEYMDSLNADYGIYIVLNFHPVSADGQIQDIHKLHIKLLDSRPYKNMHVELVNLARPDAPSKR